MVDPSVMSDAVVCALLPPAVITLLYNFGEYGLTTELIGKHPGQSAGEYRQTRYEAYGKSWLFYALGTLGRETALLAHRQG